MSDKFRRTVCSFIDRIEKDATTKCWVWTGGASVEGHPQAADDEGRSILVRRYLALGAQEKNRGKLAFSGCGNQRCVNPKHTVLAKRAQWRGQPRLNVQGRGEFAKKLTPDQRLQVIDMVRTGATQTAVALKFGVSQAMVSRMMSEAI